MGKKNWLRVIVNRDSFAEMNYYYTIQNYLKRIKSCNITEDHSLAVSQAKNEHI